MKTYLFIFRRDLRLIDNNGLNWIARKGYNISPVFIYNPDQIDRTKNQYHSEKSVQFLAESLYDLDSIKLAKKGLQCFYGETLEVIRDIIINNNIDGIVVNEDYTPYSIERDAKIRELCSDNGIEFVSMFDIPLYDFRK